MPATFTFKEDNGPATGSPARGTTAGTAVTTCNWKSIDDAVATAYSAAPIFAGQNSFIKHQYGEFSGTFNQISSVLWSPHTAGVLPTGCSIAAKVTSTYITPVVTALASATDFTAITAVASGLAVLLSTNSSPATATPTASGTANPMATQYLASQLQTTTAAPPGDIPQVTLTLQYNEN